MKKQQQQQKKRQGQCESEKLLKQHVKKWSIERYYMFF